MKIHTVAAWVSVLGTIALVALTCYQIYQLDKLRA